LITSWAGDIHSITWCVLIYEIEFLVPVATQEYKRKIIQQMFVRVPQQRRELFVLVPQQRRVQFVHPCAAAT
jgi:hypothetical protein